MTATPDDWKRLPFDATAPIPYRARFSAAQFEALSQGLVPEAMEDKWFIYFAGGDLCFYRSWTGEAVYRLTLAAEGDEFAVTKALCSVAVLDNSTAEYEAELVDFLIHNLMLGAEKPFPVPEGVTVPAPSIYQHVISGTGYAEITVTHKPWWKFWA